MPRGQLAPDLFLATIGEAVGRYVESFDVDWQDRES
jgi:hypothetical protein